MRCAQPLGLALWVAFPVILPIGSVTQGERHHGQSLDGQDVASTPAGGGWVPIVLAIGPWEHPTHPFRNLPGCRPGPSRLVPLRWLYESAPLNSRDRDNAQEHQCGGGGIRTHEAPKDLAVFKTAAFDRSATPPSNILACFRMTSLVLSCAHARLGPVPPRPGARAPRPAPDVSELLRQTATPDGSGSSRRPSPPGRPPARDPARTAR